MVNGIATKQVIAGHIVFLPYAMRPVFTLTAVGIRPWKFHKRNIGRCREGKTDTCRLDGADYELCMTILKRVHSRLFLHKGITSGHAYSLGECFFQSIHNLMIGAEQYEGFAIGEKGIDKIDSLPNLALPTMTGVS